MATVDQLKPILTGRFVDALNRILDPANRVGDMRRLADDIGVSYESVRSWTYGESAPGMVAFIALCDARPGFEDSVRGGISPTPEERETAAQQALEAVAEASREYTAKVEAIIGGNVVVMKGRVS